MDGEMEGRKLEPVGAVLSDGVVEGCGLEYDGRLEGREVGLLVGWDGIVDGRELKIVGVSDEVTDGRELELGIVEGLELESVGKCRILASRQCTSVELLPSLRRKQTFLAPRTVSPLS
jgi:hypothetical protein